MPLGRPVVPDEYSIAVPMLSSDIGVFGSPAGGFLKADDAFALARAVDDDAEVDLGAFPERLARDLEFCP